MDLFHVLNRGVDKRNIFLDDGDCIRFIHNMFEFNKSSPANNTASHLEPSQLAATPEVLANDLRSRYSTPRQKIVGLHGWVLMRNHYHLLLSEHVEGGLTQFIRKLNIGYAKFFN